MRQAEPIFRPGGLSQVDDRQGLVRPGSVHDRVEVHERQTEEHRQPPPGLRLSCAHRAHQPDVPGPRPRRQPQPGERRAEPVQGVVEAAHHRTDIDVPDTLCTG